MLPMIGVALVAVVTFAKIHPAIPVHATADPLKGTYGIPAVQDAEKLTMT